jgi:hypothetical protein
MRSLKHSFEQVQYYYPNLTTYCQFVEAIKNRRFSKETITKYFYELVHPSEYEYSERLGILQHLYRLSNPL